MLDKWAASCQGQTYGMPITLPIPVGIDCSSHLSWKTIKIGCSEVIGKKILKKILENKEAKEIGLQLDAVIPNQMKLLCRA